MLLVLAGVYLLLFQGHAAAQNLDDLIKEVFGTNATTPTNNREVPPTTDNNNNNNNNKVVDERGVLDEEDCVCVPYYLCPNGSVLTDGTGLLDIRAGQGTCKNYMDRCCKEPLDPNQPLKPKPTTRRGCGQRHADGVGFRITGDNNHEAQFGEFPWMVALLKKTLLAGGEELMVYQCGGALIHEQVVLTAAHCVVPQDDNSQLEVRVGEWDTQTANEIYPHQNMLVKRTIIHPNFKRGNLHNDYAILLLEKPVVLGENVDTICLPASGEVPLSRECYATGWGKNEFEETAEKYDRQRKPERRRLYIPILSEIRTGIQNLFEELARKTVGTIWPNRRRGMQARGTTGHRGPTTGEAGTYQVILKKIDLPIVPKGQCIDLLRKTRLGPYYRLHDSFVCAGGIIGKDTCKGDGGSPLACPIQGKEGTYEVTGLVSWGIGCGNETPGVYAGVAYAKPWINEELRKAGISIEN